MARELSESSSSPYRWMMLFLASFQILSINYLQFQVSPLAYVLAPLYGLDPGQIASLLFAPLLAGVVLSIPGGIACDKAGPHLTIGVAAALSAFAGFFRVVADSYAALFCAMLVSGVCPAILQASSIKIFHAWFEGRANFAMGVFFASASLGSAVAQATSNLFPDIRSAFLFSAIVFAASAIAWIFFARNLPPGRVPPGEAIGLFSFKKASESSKVWLVACAVGLGMATSTAYMGLLPQAYIEIWGANAETAGVMAAVLSLGCIVGSVAAPPLCNALGRPGAFLASVVVAGFFLKLFSWICFDSYLIWAILFANGICGAAAGPILEALPASFSEIGHEHAGSAGGIIGSASLACSYFLPVCISSATASNYGANMMLESAFFLLSAIPIVLLRLDGKRSEAQ